MKIDVEGGELSVMKSLFNFNTLKPKHIIFEFLPDKFSYGVSPVAFCEYLEGLGYQLKTVDGDRFQLDGPLPESNVWAELVK